MKFGEFSPLNNDPRISNIGRKTQNQGTERESLVTVIFQSANLRKKDKGRPDRLTWITTVLAEGQDPMGARLKGGRKAENRDQEPPTPDPPVARVVTKAKI